MAQAGTGVLKSVKVLLILIILILVHNKSFSQDNGTDFQRNFIKTLHYPDFLKSSCTPTFANLLIDVSENGSIKELQISDSASKMFVDEFDKVKSQLNIQLINQIIAARKLKGVGIIIPIFYVYGQDYCTNSFADFVSNRYLTFNGKPYNKPVINLDPIFVSFYKPVN